MSACGRCQRPVAKSVAEACWFCSGPLCGECWEQYGHCGHPEAYRIDAKIRSRLDEEIEKQVAEWESQHRKPQ